jgi:hypothetical protein
VTDQPKSYKTAGAFRAALEARLQTRAREQGTDFARAQRLEVLSDLSATGVATAAFAGLRLGELRGLTWELLGPAQDEKLLGWLNATGSVWRSTVGDPKTAKIESPSAGLSTTRVGRQPHWK